MEENWCFICRAGIHMTQESEIRGCPSRLLIHCLLSFQQGVVDSLLISSSVCVSVELLGSTYHRDCISSWTAWKQFNTIKCQHHVKKRMQRDPRESQGLAVPLYLFVASFFSLIATFFPLSMKPSLSSNIHSKPFLWNATRNLNAKGITARDYSNRKINHIKIFSFFKCIIT